MSRTPVSNHRPLADCIDDLLPQTQCGQCGFRGCRPYAEALAEKKSAINRCPPGGPETIEALATLLGTAPIPMDSSCGITSAPSLARIDEDRCIGCALCLAACPVDAIIGARKYMHTVIAAECTGCALCLPPCPVDCITLEPTGALRDRAAQVAAAPRLRARFNAHARREAERAALKRKPAAATADAAARKKAAVERALARAKARLSR